MMVATITQTLSPTLTEPSKISARVTSAAGLLGKPEATRVPMVSVWLITYNHEQYIRDAIEGVLLQQTDFEVELIIGEDCSSDNTRAIVQSYKDSYPDKIKLFLSPTNLGMVPVLAPTYQMCTGKYIAMLDGDDYWTNPLKLQKQVDVMEADESCHLTFHATQVHDLTRQQVTVSAEPTWHGAHRQLDLHELIYLTNPVQTVSAVFRKPDGLPAYYYDLPYPDLAMYYIVLAAGGKAVYLPDVMGVYRLHPGGAYTSMSRYERLKNLVSFLGIVLHQLPLRYFQQIESELLSGTRMLMVEALKRGEMQNFVKCFRRIDWARTPQPGASHSRVHRFGLTGLRLLARLGARSATDVAQHG